MLLRFVVSNFLSFDRETEFNLFPYTRLREQKDHIHATPEMDLLKAAAIYGANGAGKSNLIKAMQFLRDIATDGSESGRTVEGSPFRLGKAAATWPSTLEVEFFSGSQYFAYGIEVSKGAITEEYLYATSPKKENQQLLFSRETTAEGTQLTMGKSYADTTEKRVKAEVYQQQFTRLNFGILSTLARDDDYPEIRLAHRWLANQFSFVYPSMRIASLGKLLKEVEPFATFCHHILPELDTGIERIAFKRMSYDEFFGVGDVSGKEKLAIRLKTEGAPLTILHRGREPILVQEAEGQLVVDRLVFLHRGEAGREEWFTLTEESDGTQRVLDLLAPLFSAIYMGGTVIIDEIGQSLHPELLAALLGLYMRSATSGQLIFTTHEEYVLDLDIFRRDEIWFADKSISGATSLRQLHEFKVRSDLDVHKGYLNGRFGGTPRVSGIDRLTLDHA